ncbi:MAG: hypothetical protein NNA18_07790 [Nitrospira sp.]|nr:hypothetical protein [Nitrospira sp.]
MNKDLVLTMIPEWPQLPASCEKALLEQFLRAEAMALWAVRSSQLHAVPAKARVFLERHEADEQAHLSQFECLLGQRARGRDQLPAMPQQWPVLAVQLYGYEMLGLAFAKFLVGVRPDLLSILQDERRHVGFFEQEVKALLTSNSSAVAQARAAARAWRRKLPRTLNRYLRHESFAPFRQAMANAITLTIDRRFIHMGLLQKPTVGNSIP